MEFPDANLNQGILIRNMSGRGSICTNCRQQCPLEYRLVSLIGPRTLRIEELGPPGARLCFHDRRNRPSARVHFQ